MKKTVWAALVLLAALTAQSLWAMKDKSPTCDEFSHHIASGYSHLLTGDFRMNPAMPPLPRLLSAVPLAMLGAKLPITHPSWANGDSPEFARQFFYKTNANADELVFWARVPILLLSVIFGLALFKWTSLLWGQGAGLTSLVLYVFCPDIIAHSSLATTDLAVAFFSFLTLFFFWRYLNGPATKQAIGVGICAGLALLSKFSAVCLFPILWLTAVAAGKTACVRPKRTFLFLGVCLLVVWAGYFFEIKPLLKNTPDPAKKAAVYQKIGGEGLVGFAEKVPVPLSTFASALVSMFHTRAKGTNAYLMGEWSTHGWWYYYFIAFVIKNTVPFLLLVITALFSFGKLGLGRTARAAILVPIVFFFVATLPDRAQAGIRYFLPVYPLFFMLAGGWAAYLWKRNRFSKMVVLILFGWHAAEAWTIGPNDLAYFNQLAGGPRYGYRFLRDSNIDWGQDLKGLGKYVREHKIPEVALFFFGPADPAYYGIKARAFYKDEFDKPRKAVYAIGAHQIDTVKWALQKKPEAVIGYSIFIYDFREKISQKLSI